MPHLHRHHLLPLGLLLLASSALAQYKVIGPDGKITYTDQPPVTEGAKVQTLRLGGGSGAPDLVNLPTELRQVASRYPVTLYAAANCSPCDAGRSLLNQRGVPFAEKRVESAADITALERLIGARTLPVLTIGGKQIKSFSSADWQSYLDAAGYPAESRLPASYRPPAATPLAPAAAAPSPQAVAPTRPSTEPTESPDANPGIRF